MNKKIVLLLAFMFSLHLFGCAGNSEKPITNSITSDTEIAEISSTVNNINYEEKTILDFLEITVSEKIDNKDEIVKKIVTDFQPLIDSGLPIKKYKISVEQLVLKNKMIFNGITLTCTGDQILTDEYKERLFCKCLDLDEKDIWKKYAYYAYLYDEIVDVDKVGKIINDAETKDILSMFPAYFSTYFYSDAQINENSMVAKAYGKYIINTYGFAKLYECKANEYTSDWLISIGENITYQDPYADLFNEFTYEENDFTKSLIIKTDQNISFFCTPPALEGNNVKLLRSFLFEAHNTVEKIFEKVSKEAPTYWGNVKDKLTSSDLRIFFDLELDNIEGYYEKNEIHLNNYSAFHHEVCHYLFSDSHSNKKTQFWKEEGLANYCMFIMNDISTYKYGQKENHDKYIENGRDHYSEDITRLVYYDSIILYSEKYGRIEQDSDYKIKEFEKIRAQVESIWQNEGRETYSIAKAYESIGTDTGNSEDSRLTYSQATFFVEYLINNYSLENYLKFYFEDATFEEAFGKSFDEIYECWKNDFLKDV